MLRGFLLVAALASGFSVPPVVVRDPGPGPVGRYLADVLAAPTTRVLVGDTVRVSPDSTYPTSLVILAKRAIVSGRINGDVIVVGGDLFVHPGAIIGGQAVAIGGGVHRSLLAQIRGGVSDYREFTFVAQQVNGVTELRYEVLQTPPPGRLIPLPFDLATSIPTYDRTNGLSLSLGPAFRVGTIDGSALATYRSQLGALDPSINAAWIPSRRARVDLFAGRDTRSNEDWIRSDLANSVEAFFLGRDGRNWYRADVAELTESGVMERPSMVTALRLGQRFERAWSVRPDSGATGGPWSFVRRKDADDGGLRPNPQFASNHLSSVFGGPQFAWTASDLKARLGITAEVPVTASGRRFLQTTVDAEVRFPTFGSQSFRFDAHAILTAGDTAPPQRWGYLGGAGTIGTIEPLLALGGDQLLFVESRYQIPIDRVVLPLVGSPTVTIRHMLGSAGVRTLPSLTQVLGLRLSLSFARIDLMEDVNSGKRKITGGVSLSR